MDEDLIIHKSVFALTLLAIIIGIVAIAGDDWKSLSGSLRIVFGTLLIICGVFGFWHYWRNL